MTSSSPGKANRQCVAVVGERFLDWQASQCRKEVRRARDYKGHRGKNEEREEERTSSSLVVSRRGSVWQW